MEKDELQILVHVDDKIEKREISLFFAALLLRKTPAPHPFSFTATDKAPLTQRSHRCFSLSPICRPRRRLSSASPTSHPCEISTHS